MKGHVSFIEYKRLLESTFRLQCKIEKDADIDHIVMKWNPYGTSFNFIPKGKFDHGIGLHVSIIEIFCKYRILFDNTIL